MNTNENHAVEPKTPPERSWSFLSDILLFMWRKPKVKTLVAFDSAEKRLEYNERILQRVGEDVNHYRVLNVHKIDIEAPPHYIFDELLNWNGDSTCWPNHIARVERIDGDIQSIRILPFGWHTYPYGMKKSFLGLHFIPLFNLNAIKIKRFPDAFDFDNARYLLYRCSGGYPIGIFTMYVRTSIPEAGEKGQSQLLFAVGFNFYGKERKSGFRLMNLFWETIHNRVTSNVLNKVKQLSEWRISKMEAGM